MRVTTSKEAIRLGDAAQRLAGVASTIDLSDVASGYPSKVNARGLEVLRRRIVSARKILDEMDALAAELLA